MDLPCLLCKRNTVRHWFVRKNGTNNYPIVRCNSCKSAYCWPRPKVDAVQELYSDCEYSPTHGRLGLYWPSSERDAARLLKSFSPFVRGRTFLDIGAGSGVAAAEAILHGFDVRACEPSPQCRKEFLDRNGFEPESTFFNSDYAERNRHQVDVVMLSHVLEHVPDPEQLMNDVSLVLRSGGTVIISVPLFGSVLTSVMGKRDFFITPPEHLTYFSHAGLGGLLERHGYHVESMHTSSKVNMLRYRNRLGPVCFPVNMAAYSVLKFSELFNRSVVLNVCARSVQPS
jgi:2-polyprenyl-3-methyl-5-hydroxy-6-metoxy-1,4-benzoquinol methylase